MEGLLDIQTLFLTGLLLLSTTHISTHTMSCCCLYPCRISYSNSTCHVLLLLLPVPMLGQLQQQHTPCPVAIAACTHDGSATATAHAMSCCYCCLYPCWVSYSNNTRHVLLLLLPVPMLGQLPLQHTPCPVAIAACTHVGSATATAYTMSCCYCCLYPC